MRIQNIDIDSKSILRRATDSLKTPDNLFAGLRLSQAMTPDNIVFFKRTDIEAFKPEGVSNNYHHRFELVVIIEKGGPVRIDDTNFLLQAGDAALIFPNQFHHYMDVEQGKIEWLFITFELKNAEAIASLRGAPRVLDPSELHLLAVTLMEYVHPAKGEPDIVEISHHLARLLRSMVDAPEIPSERRGVQSGKSPRDILLERMNRYVRQHLKEAPTINDLATALDYSVSHLRAVFRTELGVSLGKYIRESRLSTAAALLQSTDMNISDVAKESGFKSLFVFSRAFKKAYGMAPKAYSKMVQ